MWKKSFSASVRVRLHWAYVIRLMPTLEKKKKTKLLLLLLLLST